MTDRLGRLLFVTLEAARVDADAPVPGALRSWLNSWRGTATSSAAMEHQGYGTCNFTRRWRATALDYERDRVGVGAHTVARDAASGVGGADQGVRVNGKKVGRNDPCVCGSGKKFKVCCIDVVLAEERQRRDLEQTRGKGQRDLDDHTGRYSVGAPWVR